MNTNDMIRLLSEGFRLLIFARDDPFRRFEQFAFRSDKLSRSDIIAGVAMIVSVVGGSAILLARMLC